MLRCPLCANLSHTALSLKLLRCNLCALVFHRGSTALPALEAFRSRTHYIFPAWNTWSYRLTGSLALRSPDAIAFTRQTVRMLAARHGCRGRSVATSLPLVPVHADWPWGATIRADLQPWHVKAALPDPRLTLGVIAAGDAVAAVVQLCARAGCLGRDIIVVLDTAGASVASELENQLRDILDPVPGRRVSVIPQRLHNDFANQRNRIQAAARTAWVLQLDTDEEPAHGLSAVLPELLDDAESLGWSAIGLTRRNVVDGVVSALYPDPQFRLLRQHVRYTRKVHEYPDLPSFRASFVHLGPGLIHHIPGWRLAQRQERYETLQDGAGRPNDTALLRQPLEMEA